MPLWRSILLISNILSAPLWAENSANPSKPYHRNFVSLSAGHPHGLNTGLGMDYGRLRASVDVPLLYLSAGFYGLDVSGAWRLGAREGRGLHLGAAAGAMIYPRSGSRYYAGPQLEWSGEEFFGSLGFQGEYWDYQPYYGGGWSPRTAASFGWRYFFGNGRKKAELDAGEEENLGAEHADHETEIEEEPEHADEPLQPNRSLLGFSLGLPGGLNLGLAQDWGAWRLSADAGYLFLAWGWQAGLAHRVAGKGHAGIYLGASGGYSSVTPLFGGGRSEGYWAGPHIEFSMKHFYLQLAYGYDFKDSAYNQSFGMRERIQLGWRFEVTPRAARRWRLSAEEPGAAR